MDTLMKHQSLQMCVSSYSPVQLNSTEDLLIWLQQDSHVSHSQLQENKMQEKTKEICGLPLSESFAQLGQNIACSKMYPASLEQESKHNVWITGNMDLFGTSTPYSETWPKQGTMQDGVCWEQMIVERITEEKDSGYMPTPNTLDYLDPRSEEAMEKQYQTQRKGRSAPSNLREWVDPKMWPTPVSSASQSASMQASLVEAERLHPKGRTHLAASVASAVWPTPTCQDSNKASKRWRDNHQNNLTAAVFNPERIFPTPTTRDYKGGYDTKSLTRKDGKSRAFDALPNAVLDGKGVETVKGKLNPDWVEWLMGWPIGWTSLEKIYDLVWLDIGVEPTEIPRVSERCEKHRQRLQAIGNGQVSITAATAWRLLHGA